MWTWQDPLRNASVGVPVPILNAPLLIPPSLAFGPEGAAETYIGKESLTIVRMAEVATVTSKGQVTLPASIRKKLGLRKGSKLIFLEEERGVRLVSGEELDKRFAIFEMMAAETNLSPKRLSALVKEAKDRLWREHYASRH